MGNFMREYWVPAMLSSELPNRTPIRVRVMLLGEQLIAFRDTNGKVGLIQNHCPHRGASLFFGRNEEAGLRCVYHGWKFDVDGNCIDMPNEPAESDFKIQSQGRGLSDARARRHRLGLHGPAHDAAAAAGPRRQHAAERRSARPRDAAAEQLAADPRGRHRHDPRRVPALRRLKAEDQPPGTLLGVPASREARRTSKSSTRRPARPTARGARPATARYYWRIAQWCFPFYTFTPPGVLGIKKGVGARVPMDDYHTHDLLA